MTPEDKPQPQPQGDPFEDWYKNTIQANPNKYDTTRSKAQWQAWYPLWDSSSGGFRSSKVDAQGNPIQGNQFSHPDECPAGMQAYGANACVPQGQIPGGGGPGGMGGNQFMPGPYKPPYAPDYNFPALPTFNFPTGVTELNDPGYQFRLQQGEGALQASAAARGVLNTGGTLQDILKYGQNYASQEYGNVFQRAKDAYAPLLAEWQMKAGATAAERQRAWENYQFMLNQELARQQMVINSKPPDGY